MLLRRSQQQAIARLHQMASLDCTGAQLITAVLRELRRVVAFDSGSYYYPDKHGALEAYLESPALQAVMPDYFDPQVLRSERQILCRSLLDFDDIVRHQRGWWMLEPGQLLTVSRDALHRSAYYEALMRPADLSTWVSLVLRTPQGRGLGMLSLYRHSGAPAFTQEELAILMPLEACLARALQPGEFDSDDLEVQATGLLIVSPGGRLLWLSPDAEHLLPRAFGWRWRKAGQRAHDTLPQAVQPLLQRLQTLWHKDRCGPLPQMQWRNASGCFSLRATRLTAATHDLEPSGDAVALHITEHVKRDIRLLAALQTLALSRRQHELAYWIARGHSESQIATRMGVRIPTVVYHRRALYERLRVPDRNALLARLARPREPGP